jgi:hypothetical protein
MVAVNSRRHCDLVAPRLHELQHSGLTEHILEHDAVGPQLEETFAGLKVLQRGIIKMSEQNLFGQRERSRQSAPRDRDIPR